MAKTTLDVLREDYPGQAVLNTDQIAKALSKTGKAGPQTIRNQISAKRFPLQDKLRKIGGVWVLSIVAVADLIDGNLPDPQDAAPAKKKAGRPRKSVSEWLDALDLSWQKILDEHAADLASVMKPGTGGGRKKDP